MSLVHLRHSETGAEIAVEEPPTGLSPTYLRAGWEQFTPPPPKPESKRPASKPVIEQPASAPDDTKKE